MSPKEMAGKRVQSLVLGEELGPPSGDVLVASRHFTRQSGVPAGPQVSHRQEEDSTLESCRWTTPPIGEGSVLSEPRSAHVQRLFDLIVGCGLLVIGAPLMIVIAVLIKFTSPGPIFYTQQRVGRGGTTFRLLKFRSMHVNAEQATGPIFAVPNDTRSTLIGGWLRRSCLDELPQLWNVLRGEMSLVGPRPERPYFVDQFRRRLLRYDCRHLVRPGITGWSQVSGWRGCTSIEQRLRFDLEYVQRRSLLFDLRILLLTPLAVLFPNRGRRLAGNDESGKRPAIAGAVSVGFEAPAASAGKRQKWAA